MAALVVLIERAEHLYRTASETINAADRQFWTDFLTTLMSHAVIENENINKMEKTESVSLKSVDDLLRNTSMSVLQHMEHFGDVETTKKTSLVVVLGRYDIEY